MALLPILVYPDPRLHTVAKPVAAVDSRIERLVDDMLETMYEAKGIGLAATQVDVHQRVIVIDTSEERNTPLVLINPALVWTSPETHLNEEGCLSVPGIYDGVVRFDAIHGAKHSRFCKQEKRGRSSVPWRKPAGTFDWSSCS